MSAVKPSRRYAEVLEHVTAEPKSAHDIYMAWSKIAPRKSLNRRQRNDRRWVALALTGLSDDGLVSRDETSVGVRFRRTERGVER